jgi:biopolymer transport protein ExbB
MSNSFGLIHIWQQGDSLIRFLLLVLLFMSVSTWSIFIIKLYGLKKMQSQAKLIPEFWSNQHITHANHIWSSQLFLNPFKQLSWLAKDLQIRLNNNSEQLMFKNNDPLWDEQKIVQCLENIKNEMQSAMGVLSSIAATAPFVGLLGTVWGIYHALINIGLQGQISMAQISGPIGETLIMTALGLAVAIPAVLSNNFIARKNKNMILKIQHFSNDISLYLKEKRCEVASNTSS